VFQDGVILSILFMSLESDLIVNAFLIFLNLFQVGNRNSKVNFLCFKLLLERNPHELGYEN